MDRLNYDDLLVVKSSMECESSLSLSVTLLHLLLLHSLTELCSYVLLTVTAFTSKIHPVYGSLMVRALVSSMYKHAGHHDLCTIFKQVS